VCQLFLKLIVNNLIIIVQRIELNLSLKRMRSEDSKIDFIVQNKSYTISTGNKMQILPNLNHENVILVFLEIFLDLI